MPFEATGKPELEVPGNNAAASSRFESGAFNPPPFRPCWWLRGGHMQTLAGNFLKREDHLPYPETRTFEVDHGVRVLCQCHWQPERTRAKTLIIVHGLEGSSASKYVIGTSNKAWDAGMNVVRMNMRNCGGSEELTPTLYHSGLSGDVGAVMESLIRDERLTRIALAGFSMGGNLVLKLAGELGDNPPSELVGVAAVSPAMDLAKSVETIHRPSNRIYEWHFLRGLNRRLKLKAQLFPGRYETHSLFSIRSIWEFDDKVTARYCGFAGADDYYYRASAARTLDRVALPTLILHSLDDPFIVMTPETRAKVVANPNILFLETKHGGHCAFIGKTTRSSAHTLHSRGFQKDDGRWAERQVVDFVLNLAGREE